MEGAIAGFSELTAELKIISASLDSIVRRVESGEGTLGKLVNEDAAHEEFLAAIKEVRELVRRYARTPRASSSCRCGR